MSCLEYFLRIFSETMAHYFKCLQNGKLLPFGRWVCFEETTKGYLEPSLVNKEPGCVFFFGCSNGEPNVIRGERSLDLPTRPLNINPDSLPSLVFVLYFQTEACLLPEDELHAPIHHA